LCWYSIFTEALRCNQTFALVKIARNVFGCIFLPYDDKRPRLVLGVFPKGMIIPWMGDLDEVRVATYPPPNHLAVAQYQQHQRNSSKQLRKRSYGAIQEGYRDVNYSLTNLQRLATGSDISGDISEANFKRRRKAVGFASRALWYPNLSLHLEQSVPKHQAERRVKATKRESTAGAKTRVEPLVGARLEVPVKPRDRPGDGLAARIGVQSLANPSLVISKATAGKKMSFSASESASANASTSVPSPKLRKIPKSSASKSPKPHIPGQQAYRRVESAKSNSASQSPKANVNSDPSKSPQIRPSPPESAYSESAPQAAPKPHHQHAQHPAQRAGSQYPRYPPHRPTQSENLNLNPCHNRMPRAQSPTHHRSAIKARPPPPPPTTPAPSPTSYRDGSAIHLDAHSDQDTAREAPSKRTQIDIVSAVDARAVNKAVAGVGVPARAGAGTTDGADGVASGRMAHPRMSSHPMDTSSYHPHTEPRAQHRRHYDILSNPSTCDLASDRSSIRASTDRSKNSSVSANLVAIAPQRQQSRQAGYEQSHEQPVRMHDQSYEPSFDSKPYDQAYERSYAQPYQPGRSYGQPGDRSYYASYDRAYGDRVSSTAYSTPHHDGDPLKHHIQHQIQRQIQHRVSRPRRPKNEGIETHQDLDLGRQIEQNVLDSQRQRQRELHRHNVTMVRHDDRVHLDEMPVRYNLTNQSLHSQLDPRQVVETRQIGDPRQVMNVRQVLNPRQVMNAHMDPRQVMDQRQVEDSRQVSDHRHVGDRKQVLDSRHVDPRIHARRVEERRRYSESKIMYQVDRGQSAPRPTARRLPSSTRSPALTSQHIEREPRSVDSLDRMQIEWEMQQLHAAQRRRLQQHDSTGSSMTGREEVAHVPSLQENETCARLKSTF